MAMARRAEKPALPAVNSLEGTVHDAAGATVPNVAIEINNSATGAKANTTTDTAGKFVEPSLPEGAYRVTAQASGFKKETRDVVVAANQPARIDIPLQVGDVSETVAVSADTPLVPTSQIAVLDFTSNGTQNSGRQAADLLTRQIQLSGQVQVIDRDKVQQAEQTQQSRAQQPQQSREQEAAALGRSIGADAVIMGSVAEPSKDLKSQMKADDSSVALTAQVIDTRKAQRLTQVSVNGASLEGATNRLGAALTSQLGQPLEGAVTKVARNTATVLFLAPGEPRIGAKLNVYRDNRRIGELIVTSASGRNAEGKFSGSKPRKGDRVTSAR
jgi:hypothetical protein